MNTTLRALAFAMSKNTKENLKVIRSTYYWFPKIIKLFNYFGIDNKFFKFTSLQYYRYLINLV